ncbi:hypothetical protein MKW92_028156 [Papaver armeniacum]|nr:hypothetical protein MKW92_028156 [Papaver armeniacum]
MLLKAIDLHDIESNVNCYEYFRRRAFDLEKGVKNPEERNSKADDEGEKKQQCWSPDLKPLNLLHETADDLQPMDQPLSISSECEDKDGELSSFSEIHPENDKPSTSSTYWSLPSFSEVKDGELPSFSEIHPENDKPCTSSTYWSLPWLGVRKDSKLPEDVDNYDLLW